MGSQFPEQGSNPHSLFGRQSLNHWTTRKSQDSTLLSLQCAALGAGHSSRARVREASGRGRGAALTQDEVELGLRLEGVVQRHQEGRLPDVLQHLPLRPRVLRALGLLHYGGLPQNLHGVQLPSVVATDFTHEKHLSVSWNGKETSEEALKGYPGREVTERRLKGNSAQRNIL